MTVQRVENGALEMLNSLFRNVRGVQALWTLTNVRLARGGRPRRGR